MGWQDAPEVSANPAWMNAPEVGADSTAKEAKKGTLANIGLGALKGASDIGRTILTPLDKLGITGMTSEERKAALARFFEDNADPNSIAFKGGELGSQIAGTAGAGGVLAKGASMIPQLAKFAPVIESGGFNLGNAATNSTLANAAIRAGGGAIQGGASAAMVNPEEAGTGAVIGAAAPGVIKGAGIVGDAISGGMDSVARKLMTSAMKPTIKQHRTGQAASAVQTMLDEGLNATKGGVEALKGRIGGLNDEIANAIQNSDANVSKSDVASYLSGVRDKFARQVSPTSDMNAIDKVEADFMNHPMLGGSSAPARKGQSIFVDGYGNIVKDVNVPAEPQLRNLLDEIKRSGGLSTSELADLGVEKVSKNYPGLLRKDGGMKMDRLVEWLDQNGWMVPGQVDDLERNAVGGSHEYARDLLRDALAREKVIHPADYDSYAAFSDAIRKLEDQGIRQVTIPGTDKIIPSDSPIPVKLAQELKQGTYKVLKGKYGEAGSAETEAQKALARGLKDKIAEAVPDVSGLNARESKLLDALSVAERRAMMSSNNNPAGISMLSPDGFRLAAFLADRSDLLKSLAARGVYQASKAHVPQALPNLMEQYGLLGAPSVLATSP